MEALWPPPSPARMKVFEYGESWEGRKLIYAAVGSEANIRQPAGNQERHAADRRPSQDAGSRGAQASWPTLPAVVWLSYGVHGNEISSPDAALLTAYHLLAARERQDGGRHPGQDLVLIDPTQNPDGRDRFVNYFEQARGLTPDASPNAAEHNEPWPGGRVNHYLFDLNRDWLGAHASRRSPARCSALREWYPLVYVDLHEMGAEATYFFTPESRPLQSQPDPNSAREPEPVRQEQREVVRQIRLRLLHARTVRRVLSRVRRKLAVLLRRARHDLRAGLGARPGGAPFGRNACSRSATRCATISWRRFPRWRRRRRIAISCSTISTSTGSRAIEEGRRPSRSRNTFCRAAATRRATDKLAGILMEHGIEVNRAKAPFRRAIRSTPPVPTWCRWRSPPSASSARCSIRETTMDDKFVAAEEVRRKLKQRTEIYDVTAWSLPLLFNVEAIASARGCGRAASSRPNPRASYRVKLHGSAASGGVPGAMGQPVGGTAAGGGTAPGPQDSFER